MGDINVWNTYYEELKVTKSDLSANLVEANGHKIGDLFDGSQATGAKALVYITKKGHVSLVDTNGKADLLELHDLDGLKKLPERQLDWLTWQYKGYPSYYHGPLSNFYVERDGKTLEHRFAAAKTTDLEQKALIFSQKTPGMAKKLGKKVSLRPDWDEIKRDLMWDLLLKKFMTNTFARKYLLATGDAIIQEKNTWNDRIWGVNLQNQGQNLLGMGLMYVREVLNDS